MSMKIIDVRAENKDLLPSLNGGRVPCLFSPISAVLLPACPGPLFLLP